MAYIFILLTVFFKEQKFKILKSSLPTCSFIDFAFRAIQEIFT